MRADVSSGKDFFEMSKELRVDRNHIFEVAVRSAVFDHQNLAVAFENGGFDLADFLGQQHAQVFRAVKNFLTRFAHTEGAKRICLSGQAERWLGLLPRFQKRLIGPARRKGSIWAEPVHTPEYEPSAIRPK